MKTPPSFTVPPKPAMTLCGSRCALFSLRTLWIAAVSAILASSAFAAAVSVSYNFDDLATGNLVSQDGWAYASGTISPVVAALADHGNALGAAATTGIVYKAYGSSFYNGNETDALLQFDAMNTGRWGLDAVGITGNGHTYQPTLWSGVGVLLQLNSGGTLDNAIELRLQEPTTGVYTTYTSTISLSFNVWYSLRAVMDFTANGGNGSVSVYYTPAGASAWAAVDGLQNINMGLSKLAEGYTPSAWNQILIRNAKTTSDVYLDNIAIGVVPEPTALAMLVSGLGIMIFSRRACRRLGQQ